MGRWSTRRCCASASPKWWRRRTPRSPPRPSRPDPYDPAVPFARYVAIGDSQTEGLLDPDGRGGYRGWADRFAEILTGVSPHLSYANLAVRGRLLGAIRAEQVGTAVAMEPDIATVMGGLNDVLRPGFSPAAAIA